MVYRDPLTGLANRRKWDQQFEARCKSLATLASPAVLAVVLFDLDLFNRLNDVHGHVTGDQVLRRVGQALAANLAGQHLAARLGGDEFAVLLSGLLATDIPGIVDSLRRSLETPVQGQVDVSPVTASSGVVIVEAGANVPPQKVLEGADLALRMAKQQGRNRMVIGSIAQ
jgi:diguanylate cyclase (GGDEF)-like protein